MKKIVISVLGCDRPGIIAAVSKTLFENRCNIEDVSQTTLQTEFVGIFIAAIPELLSEEDLLAKLREELTPMGLSVVLKPVQEAGEWVAPASEPFVITTLGPDRLGLVAGITEVLARFGINITEPQGDLQGRQRSTTQCHDLRGGHSGRHRSARLPGRTPRACGGIGAGYQSPAPGYFRDHSQGIGGKMLTDREILSTLEMLKNEHLDVRTVTLGISLFDCADQDAATALCSASATRSAAWLETWLGCATRSASNTASRS